MADYHNAKGAFQLREGETSESVIRKLRGDCSEVEAERDAALSEVNRLTKEIRGLYASESEALASCRAARLELEAENESLATEIQRLKRQLSFSVAPHPAGEDV